MKKDSDPQRREFLKAGIAGCAALTALPLGSIMAEPVNLQEPYDAETKKLLEISRKYGSEFSGKSFG
ncbi:MAG: hypothetical protein GY863_10335 [bacterium]|nr:hypothetical protein [bacterium]